MIENILEYLEQTAARVPDRTAFYDDSHSITYAQMLAKAKSMGSYLADKVPTDGVVALLTDGHGIMSVPAMLGVLYAGCAYSPLDPSQPAERLLMTLEQMKPCCILVDEKGRKAISGLSAELPTVIDCEAAFLEPHNDAALQEIREESTPDDAMSVLYTSGSTGIPKGSVQPHSSYIGYTEATNRIYGFDESVVFGCQSPFFYANSIIDIFPPIALGAKVYLLPNSALTFPKKFQDAMRENRVSELTMTPSSFLALADAMPEGSLPDLRWGIMSGEAMPWKPLQKWMQAAPNADFWNFYGSTEAFSVAVGRVTGEHADGVLLPVGKPFREVEILFLDEEGKPASAQTGGEMLISSPWISAGYRNDPGRTQAAFPLISNQRYYRTGDLGRINENGQLLVLGRKDSQIKHHGYRMEIGEVEAALRSLPEWSDGCVLYHRESDELYCFFTGAVDEKLLRSALRSKLPRPMLPDQFIHLQALPQTSTRKLDRTALRIRYMQKEH